MPRPDNPLINCRHDRAPLKRLAKITYQKSGRRVYMLLCTACGFTVTTEQLRRLRAEAKERPAAPVRQAPAWAPAVRYLPAYQ